MSVTCRQIIKSIWDKIIQRKNKRREIVRIRDKVKSVKYSFSPDKVILNVILKYVDVKILTYPISKLWVKLSRDTLDYPLLQSQDICKLWKQSIQTRNHRMFEYVWSFINFLEDQYKYSFIEKGVILLGKEKRWNEMYELGKTYPLNFNHIAGYINFKDLITKYFKVPYEPIKYITGLFEGGHLGSILDLNKDEWNIIYNSLTDLIPYSARNGHVHILEYMNPHILDEYLINSILEDGYAYNHESIIKYALNKGADNSNSYVMFKAIKAGNIELIKTHHYNFYDGPREFIAKGIEYNHLEILKMGLDSIYEIHTGDLYNYVRSARRRGYIHLVKIINRYFKENPKKLRLGQWHP